MFNKIDGLKNKSSRWFANKAHGSGAKIWLALLSFTESSFFLIPPDVLLIAIILAGATRWVYYALFTAAFSVAGALFGYFIGVFFFDLVGENIIDFYNLHQELQLVKGAFNDNVFWVMFLASFTPVPYKVFVLTGGFLKVNLIFFFVASVVGRSIRFLMVSYLVNLFRPGIVRAFFRYFNIITYLAVAIILIWILAKFDVFSAIFS